MWVCNTGSSFDILKVLFISFFLLLIWKTPVQSRIFDDICFYIRKLVFNLIFNSRNFISDKIDKVCYKFQQLATFQCLRRLSHVTHISKCTWLNIQYNSLHYYAFLRTFWNAVTLKRKVNTINLLLKALHKHLLKLWIKFGFILKWELSHFFNEGNYFWTKILNFIMCTMIPSFVIKTIYIQAT